MGCEVSSSHFVSPRAVSVKKQASMADKACDALDISGPNFTTPATNYSSNQQKGIRVTRYRVKTRKFDEDSGSGLNQSTNMLSKRSEEFIIKNSRKMGSLGRFESQKVSNAQSNYMQKHKLSNPSLLILPQNKNSESPGKCHLGQSFKLESPEEQSCGIQELEAEVFTKSLSDEESLLKADLDVSPCRRARKSREALKKSCYNFSTNDISNSRRSLERNALLMSNQDSGTKSASKGEMAGRKSRKLKLSSFGNFKLNSLLPSCQEIDKPESQTGFNLKIRRAHKRVTSNQVIEISSANKRAANELLEERPEIPRRPKLKRVGTSCRVLTVREQDRQGNSSLCSILKKKGVAVHKLSAQGSADCSQGGDKQLPVRSLSPAELNKREDPRNLLASTTQQRHRVLVKVGESCAPLDYIHQAVRCVALKQGVVLRHHNPIPVQHQE
jgi:hypothetical protein